MGRLIDADMLIENAFEVHTKEFGTVWVVGVDAINEQPTSYDVEKVEDTLKNNPNVFQEFKGSYIPVENAVEVVQSNDGKGWWNERI